MVVVFVDQDDIGFGTAKRARAPQRSRAWHAPSLKGCLFSISAVAGSSMIKTHQRLRQDLFASKVEDLPGIVRRDCADHSEQPFDRIFGGEELVLGHPVLEGFGKTRIHGAGVQTDDDRIRGHSTKLDRKRLGEHVLRRFRRTVCVPASEAVVGDAADPGGETSEYRAMIVAKQSVEVLGYQERPEGVHLEDPSKRFGTHLGKLLLGGKAGPVEHSGDIDDERNRLFMFLELLRRLQNGLFVRDIEPHDVQSTGRSRA